MQRKFSELYGLHVYTYVYICVSVSPLSTPVVCVCVCGGLQKDTLLQWEKK